MVKQQDLLFVIKRQGLLLHNRNYCLSPNFILKKKIRFTLLKVVVTTKFAERLAVNFMKNKHKTKYE